jgi:periplasmic divalent cation tolerance protein
MSTPYQIILCTFPDKKTAEKCARLLIEKKLAACVNILPGITSIYLWEEQIESVQEHLLLIKAGNDFYPVIETMLFKHHPYEIPEIIAVSVERGLPEYLDWIDACHSLKK